MAALDFSQDGTPVDEQQNNNTQPSSPLDLSSFGTLVEQGHPFLTRVGHELAQGVTSSTGQAMQGFAEPFADQPTQSDLYKAGERVKQFGEKEFPLTPQEQNSTEANIVENIGGALPIIGASLVDPVAGGVLAASQFGGGSAEQAAAAARAKGASPQQVREAAEWGAASGAGLGIGMYIGGLLVPWGSIVGPLSRTAPGIGPWAANVLKNAASSGVVFTTIGEAQEYLSQQIAKIYDPKAEYSFDPKRAMSEFASGAVLGGGEAAFARRPISPGTMKSLLSLGYGPEDIRGMSAAQADDIVKNKNAKAGQAPGGIATPNAPPPQDIHYPLETSFDVHSGTFGARDQTGRMIFSGLPDAKSAETHINELNQKKGNPTVGQGVTGTDADIPLARPPEPEIPPPTEPVEPGNETAPEEKAPVSAPETAPQTPEETAPHQPEPEPTSAPEPPLGNVPSDEMPELPEWMQRPQKLPQSPEPEAPAESTIPPPTPIENIDDKTHAITEAAHAEPETVGGEMGTIAQDVQDVFDEFFGGEKGTQQNPIEANSPEAIREAEQQVNQTPSEEQKESGNYKKGHIDFQGLPITIENPKGSERTGPLDENGQPTWRATLPEAYGYIKRTYGADGDHVDAYVGPDTQSQNAYIVDQIDPDTKQFDEHKVMLGFPDQRSAEAAYQGGLSDGSGARRMGAVSELNIDELKDWLKNDNTKKPYAYEAPEPTKEPEATPEKMEPVPAEPAPAKESPIQRLEDVGERMAGKRAQVRDALKGSANGNIDHDLAKTMEASSRAKLWPVEQPKDATVGTTTYLKRVRDYFMGFGEYAGKKFGGGFNHWQDAPLKALANHARENGFENIREMAADYAAFMDALSGFTKDARTVEEARVALANALLRDRNLPYGYGKEDVFGSLNKTDLAKEAEIYSGDYSAPAKFLDPKRINEFSTVTDGTPEKPRARPLTRPKLAEINRTLPDRRGGENVTGDDLMSRFGFRGVEFGNWVNSEQRQAAVNNAYDALMDMAEALNIPPKAIGLGGRLGLAFGSRGHGGFAAAHYEPTNEVINLTRDNGDGTVAHEWMHALDHALQKDKRGAEAMKDFKRALEMRYSIGNMMSLLDRLLLKKAWIGGDKRASPEETARRFIEQYMFAPKWRMGTKTDFKADADKLGDYWKRPDELFARAGESYVYDRTRGGSPYLVDKWVAPNAVTPAQGYRGRPYPTETDRAEFAQYYDDLMRHLQFDENGKPSVGEDYQGVFAPQKARILDQMRKINLAQRRDELERGKPSLGDMWWYMLPYKTERGPETTPPGYAAYDDAHQGPGDHKFGAVGYKFPLPKATIDERKMLPIDKAPSGTVVNVEGAPDMDDFVPQKSESLGTPKAINVPNLAKAFANELDSGRTFANINEVRKWASEKLGGDVTEGYAKKMLDEAVEYGIVVHARDLLVGAELLHTPEDKVYDSLVHLYERQPILAERTSDSARRQAYSTPAPIAYVASKLAGIDKSKTVYEPTAGNGMLLIDADPKKVFANEIDPTRLANLHEIFPRVTGLDATEQNPPPAMDVVIANPPFGKVLDKGGIGERMWNTGLYNTREIDHAIALRALGAMKDDGSAVLLVASKKTMGENPEQERTNFYNGLESRAFYKQLYDQYRVIDHFTIDGDMYTRQGAAWPLDVIRIMGRGKSDMKLPGVNVPRIIHSFDELKDVLNDRDSMVPAELRSATDLGTAAEAHESGENHVPGIPGTEGGGNDQGVGGERGAADNLGANAPRQPVPGEAGSMVAVPYPDRGGIGGGETERAIGQTGVAGRGEGAGTTGGTGTETAVRPEGVAHEGGPEGAAELNDADIADAVQGAYEDIFGPEQKAEPVGAAPVKKGTEEAPSTAEGERNVDAIMKDIASLFSIEEEPESEEPLRADLLPGVDPEKYRTASGLFTELARSQGLTQASDTRTFARSIIKELVDRFNYTADRVKAALQYINQFVKDVKRGVIDLAKSVTRRRINANVDTNLQVRYEPTSNAEPVGTLMPINMQTSVKRALNALESRVGNLDEYVAQKLGYPLSDVTGTAEGPGHFAAEQVDALALAIDNLERGNGFVIGDQTGVGKGRVVAGIMRYAMQNGHTPIFITKDPALYADIYRDLRDIGMGAIKALVTNNDLRGKKKVPLSDNPDDVLESLSPHDQKKAFDQIVATGKLPPRYDALFTTYSQMQYAPQGAETPRHPVLRALAPNAILAMDESHEAGGTAAGRQKKTNKEGQEIQNRADFAREMVNGARGVLYSSATYAKNPHVMTLYSRTDMPTAVDDAKDLPDLIQKGGVPLQQVVANMLAEAGQFRRVESSYDGIDMPTKTAPTNVELADRASHLLRSVFEVDKAMTGVREAFGERLKQEGDALAADPAVGAPTITSTQFSAIMHNVIGQSLLSMKSDRAAQEAIESWKNGQKPIIALSHTFGALLDRYVDEEHLRPGDDLSKLTFNRVYENYLNRTREVGIKNPHTGDVTRHYITDEEMHELGMAPALHRFEQVRDLIRNADLTGMPASPIDHILGEMRKAGMKVDEITGRGTIVHDGKLEVRDSSAAAKKAIMNRFNEGKLDGLVINRSGSTGFSLHASSKFSEGVDQEGKRLPPNPRHMILLQGDPNIDTFMQVLGRIHRTGQIHLPRYTMLVSDLPAEKRPAAILMKKMASLNANTSANRESAVSLKGATDIMNKYGDEIVAHLLHEDHDLQDILDIHPNSEGEFPDNIAAKTTGRLAILPRAQQEAIWNQLENEYHDYIQSLDALGQNSLEAKTLDLDARTVQKRPVTLPKEGVEGPFGQPAYAETMDVKKLGRPYTQEQIVDRIKNLNGEDPLKANAEMINAHLAISAAHLDDLEMQLREAVEEKNRTQMQKPENMTPKQHEQRIEKLSNRINVLSERLKDGRERVGVISNLMNRGLARKTIDVVIGAGDARQVMKGIMLGISRDDRVKNPLSFMNYAYHVAIADAGKEIKIPFSKVQDGEFTIEKANADDVMHAFKEGASTSRERRSMVTGNILGGFDKFGGHGQITLFRDSDGNIRQGILLPRDWDEKFIEKYLDGQPVNLTPEQGVQFLDALGDQPGWFKSDDSILSVQKGQRGQYILRVQNKGGKPYYLNKTVEDMLGKQDAFSQRRGQKEWTAFAPDAQTLQKILRVYADNLGTKFITDSNKDLARKITGTEMQPPVSPSIDLAEHGVPVEHGVNTTDAPANMAAKALKGAAAYIDPTTASQRMQMARTLQQHLDQVLGKKMARVHVVDRIDMFTNQQAMGVYDHQGKNIYVTMRDLAQMSKAADHEMIHFMRDAGMISDNQWKLLERKAQDTWRPQFNTDTKYAKLAATARAAGLSDKSIEDWLNEEAVADASAAYGAGTLSPKPTGIWANLLRRVGQFHEMLRNMFQGFGPRTADKLISDIHKGRFAQNGDRPNMPAPDYDTYPRAQIEEENQPSRRSYLSPEAVVDGLFKRDDFPGRGDAAERLARWTQDYFHDYLAKHFTSDRNAAIRDASEESRQYAENLMSGETPLSKSEAKERTMSDRVGIFSEEISPDERAKYMTINQYADAAWRHAQALGRVEGSGQPFWAPSKLGERPISRMGKLADDVQKTFSPTSRTPQSRRAEQVMRANRAQRALEDARANNQLQKFRKIFNRLRPSEKWDFVDNFERGNPQPDPRLHGADTVIRHLYEQARDRVQSLGKGYLEQYRENYIRHYWKDPARAAQIEEQMNAAEGAAAGRRPLRGAGSFLKRRTIETYAEGRERGLIPLFDDPLDVVLTSIRDMNKFYYGELLKDRLRAERLIRFTRGRVPEGDRAIDDPAFQAFSPAEFRHELLPNEHDTVTDRGQMVRRGQWTAPEPVARLLNNYLSRGLYGQNSIYDTMRQANNSLNMFQLGLSAFHATFTTIDTMISRLALGIMQASRGELSNGISTGLSGVLPTAAIRSVQRGSALRNALLHPDGLPEDMQKMVAAFTAGGGRIDMDRFYRATPSRNFYEAWSNGTLLKEAIQPFKDNALTAPLHLATKAIQTISSPLMDYLVPRQKLGVFFDLAEDYMRSHPDATRRERDEFMTKAWDSVDNRLGQMVYDNVFWNHVAKDLMFLTQRSVGWNLGTIRELGGGAFTDTGRAIANIAKGNEAQFTTRMAYAMAMPLVVGLYGAMVNYMFTGQSPDDWRDYFFPRTGRATPAGTPERLIIPSYVKDVLEYSRAPVQTLLNKLSPMFETAHELYQNRDYYGGIIHNPTDPAIKQIMDTGRYLFAQATPFGIRGQRRMALEGTPQWEQALSLFGIQPAPAYITSPNLEEYYDRLHNKAAIRKERREEESGRR